MLSAVKKSRRKLLVLDYDGTLVDLAPTPQEAVLSSKALSLLSDFSKRDDLSLVVITGRSRESIEDLIGHIEIKIVAEHGATTRRKGKWETYAGESNEWKPEIAELLSKYTIMCPGSFIEEKEFAICWHYRRSCEEDAAICSKKLLLELGRHLRQHNLRLIDGKKVVEVLPANINKGTAVRNLVLSRDYESVICIGDDKTDEEMFHVLNPYDHCRTYKVGKGETAAKERLNSVEDVLRLLESL